MRSSAIAVLCVFGSILLAVGVGAREIELDSLGGSPNPAFWCEAGGPYVGTPDETITIHGQIMGGTPPYSYEWDFDDGDTESGSTSEMDIETTHAWSLVGNYTLWLQVTDSEGVTRLLADDVADVSIFASPVSERSWSKIKALYR